MSVRGEAEARRYGIKTDPSACHAVDILQISIYLVVVLCIGTNTVVLKKLSLT
jgi:hypothetical protein